MRQYLLSPHLDPEARVIVESTNGPVVQTNEGSQRFPKIVEYNRISYLQLGRRQLECENVRLRHDINGGGTVFAVGKKHGRPREVWHGTKLSRASLPPPRPPHLAGPETFGDIELRQGFLVFPVSCQNEMPLVMLTGWPSQNICAVSLDDLQSSRVESRACNLPLFHLKRHLDSTGDLKPATILYPCVAVGLWAIHGVHSLRSPSL